MLSPISAFAQRFRKQILIAFDVVVVTVSYMLPWALIAGRTSFSEYNSLLISSCFFFVCCYEIVYGLMGIDVYKRQAEERVIQELEAIQKPFIILLNCVAPESLESMTLAEELSKKYGRTVMPVSCVAVSYTHLPFSAPPA